MFLEKENIFRKKIKRWKKCDTSIKEERRKSGEKQEIII